MATGNSHELAGYRREFPILARQTYLNSCSLGALSERSRALCGTFLDEWDARGAAAWYDVWLERLAALRRGYALVIGATREEIALHASISTATAVLASALDYRRRPRVVTTALDFPTVAYQWLARRPAGVDVTIVPSPDGVSVPPQAIADAVDDRTALVATSHVFFTTGAIQDIRAVAEAAHRRGALCYIDGYQAAGQIPVDVAGSGVDFYAAGGLKWLLGGPGIAFLYVRRDLHAELTPAATGWFASRRQFAFDSSRLERHGDARRFEQGTPALAAVHTQLGGLALLEEVGLARIAAVTRALTEDLVERARAAGLSPRVAAAAADRSAIVTIPADDPPATVARLAARDIVIDARPAHVRLSPFFYNNEDDHALAVDALRD